MEQDKKDLLKQAIIDRLNNSSIFDSFKMIEGHLEYVQKLCSEIIAEKENLKNQIEAIFKVEDK